MHIFYCENLNHNTALLNEEESKHVAQVLRLRVGDAVQVIDGKGKFCEAKITIAHSKKCELELINCIADYQSRNYKLHIAIAPTKQMERFEWFLEKAVELGVDEITPLICHDSVRTVIRKDRLEKIILSAVKQSVQAYIPVLNDATPFNIFIAKNQDAIKMIAHCDEGNKQPAQNVITKNKNAVMLIGPEGDFAGDEILAALKNNFIPVTLGETRLRTETAGVYACSLLRVMNS